jgi:hypothetical protein
MTIENSIPPDGIVWHTYEGTEKTLPVSPSNSYRKYRHLKVLVYRRWNGLASKDPYFVAKINFDFPDLWHTGDGLATGIRIGDMWTYIYTYKKPGQEKLHADKD